MRDITWKKLPFLLARLMTLVISWLLIVPAILYGRAVGGLDPSWFIGLQLAIQDHFVFGRDIIFNYGPLGYFATRLPIGVAMWQYLLFDLFMATLLAGALIYLIRRMKTAWQLVLLLIVTLILQGYMLDYPSGITTLLFLLLIFLLLSYLRTSSVLLFGLAGLVSIVLFFLKLNTGLPAVLLMVSVLGYEALFRRQQRWWQLAAGSIVLLLALVVSAKWLHTDLGAYLGNSWHIINGHNDALYLNPLTYPGGAQKLTMAVALLALFALASSAALWSQRRQAAAWFAYGFAALFLFEIFKHGFVRGDEGHMRIFFIFAPALLGLLSMSPWSRRSISLVFLVAIVFSWLALGSQELLHAPTAKLQHLHTYTDLALKPMDRSVPLELQQSHALPVEIHDRIGQAGTDIIPWEIATIYANGLTYNPRPVIQSYLVTDSFLDTKNAAKYVSATAPEYILYSQGEVDNRLPFSTEAQTHLTLLTYYQPQMRFDENLLLARRATPLDLQELGITPGAGALGQTISLAGSQDIQILQADISYTLAGRAISLLYQPPPLNATLLFSDGSSSSYRAVKSLVNGGIIVNPFVSDIGQAHLFFALGQSRQVTGIRFESPAAWAYKTSFSYTVRRIALDNPSPIELPMTPVVPPVTMPIRDASLLPDSWYAADSADSVTCRWSQGNSARVYFALDLPTEEAATSRTITINTGTFHQQKISVKLNGNPVGVIDSLIDWQPADYTFAVGADVLYALNSTSRVNELEFIIPQAASPAAFDPASQDKRILGMCLWSVTIH
ncbi:MAG: hypothetical protein WAZ19_08735 [Anaerolineae bacterium]